MSTSATVTPEPVACAQAYIAPMSSPAVPRVPATDWPVFESAHWRPKYGSFGTLAAWTSPLGSAYWTCGSLLSAATAAASPPAGARSTSVFGSGPGPT